jgi:hypothetical protein
MTQSRFFQLALFFPLVLWCLCLMVFSLVYAQGAEFILKNLYYAYRVFVPYLIFAAAVWKVATDKPYRMLLLLASVVPIIWGIFFTLFYVMMSFIAERKVDEAGHVLCIMAFWATAVAYFVELVPFLVLTTFKDHFKPGPPKNGTTAEETSG